jgi:hypothetical protein
VVGPYAEWEYIGKTSASIPCQLKVKDQVESKINHFCQGKSHTSSPGKEEDVARLQASYRNSGIHINRPGRKLDAKDKVPDSMAIGSENSKLLKTMEKWLANWVSEWSSEEDWTDCEE